MHIVDQNIDDDVKLDNLIPPEEGEGKKPKVLGAFQSATRENFVVTYMQR